MSCPLTNWKSWRRFHRHPQRKTKLSWTNNTSNVIKKHGFDTRLGQGENFHTIGRFITVEQCRKNINVYIMFGKRYNRELVSNSITDNTATKQLKTLWAIRPEQREHIALTKAPCFWAVLFVTNSMYF